MEKVRVLIVEDSNLMRRLLSSILQKDARLLVVGTADNGQECLDKIPELEPDVVTLDLNMPIMDGITCLKESKARGLAPVFLVVSSLALKDAQITIDAITLGAIDYIPKPSQMLGMVQLEKEIISKVMMAAEHKRKREGGSSTPPGSVPGPAGPSTPGSPTGSIPSGALTRGGGPTGASPATAAAPAPIGGPAPGVSPVPRPAPAPVAPARPKLTIVGGGAGSMQAIQTIIPRIQLGFTGVCVFVLHLPLFFTQQLTVTLRQQTKVPIDEANDGTPLALRRIYLAPGGEKNLILARNPAGKGVVFRLVENEDMLPETPSVDKFMMSAGELFRDACRGILISGTGADGVEGLRSIKNYKGETFVQDRASAIASQLPAAALQAGVAERGLTIQEIIDMLNV